MDEFWIDLAYEPSQLLLCWEAPVGHADRNRWAVGRIRRQGAGAVGFHYFDNAEFAAANYGRPREALTAAGYLGYPAFDPTRLDHDEAVVETFMRRLPPRSRQDFPRYLEQYRVRPDGSASDLFLLGATEARLPGDGFALINPLDPGAPDCDLVIELAGHRWYIEERANLSVGQPLELVPEPQNPYDTNAIAVHANGRIIAHINRVQAPALLVWMAVGRIELHLSRLNGTEERPRAFAFLRYRAPAERVAA